MVLESTEVDTCRLCSKHCSPYQVSGHSMCGLSLMWQSPNEVRVLQGKDHAFFILESLVTGLKPARAGAQATFHIIVLSAQLKLGGA